MGTKPIWIGDREFPLDDKDTIEFAALIAKKADQFSNPYISFVDTKNEKIYEVTDENTEGVCISTAKFNDEKSALEVINAICKAANDKDISVPVYVGVDQYVEIPMFNAVELYKDNIDSEEYHIMIKEHNRVLQNIEDFGRKQLGYEEEDLEEDLENLSINELEIQLEEEQEQNRAKQDVIEGLKKQKLIERIKATIQEGKKLTAKILEAKSKSDKNR